jgi:hypothetical protein
VCELAWSSMNFVPDNGAPSEWSDVPAQLPHPAPAAIAAGAPVKGYFCGLPRTTSSGATASATGSASCTWTSGPAAHAKLSASFPREVSRRNTVV